MGKIWLVRSKNETKITKQYIFTKGKAYLDFVVGNIVDVAKDGGVGLDVVEHPAKLLHQALGHYLTTGVQQVFRLRAAADG